MGLLKQPEECSMPVLRVDLQEGFRNDTVIVRVDGAEVYRKNGVTTRLPVGVAESFEVPTAKDDAGIEVDVPTKQQSASAGVQVTQHPYLGISFDASNHLILHPSSELFRYM
jgi:hypothetical protein